MRICDLIRGSAVFLFCSKLELGIFGIFGLFLVYCWYILPTDALANGNEFCVLVHLKQFGYWSIVGIVPRRFDVPLYLHLLALKVLLDCV